MSTLPMFIKIILIFLVVCIFAGIVGYALLSFIFRPLKTGYVVEHNAVAFYELGKKISLQNADASTFVILRNDAYGAYAKDQNHVYKDKWIIEGADLATFTLIDTHSAYSKDGTYVYFNDIRIPNADPKSIHTYSGDAQDTVIIYAKDDTAVYFGEFKVEGAYPKDFIMLGNSWWKSKGYIGNGLRLIPEVDIDTFTVVSDEGADNDDGASAYDKNHRYDLSGNVL